MRSYAQYCALSKALDVVGDRWTLLIVRELLIRPCRYGELQDGLPGIASNLLAARLRDLEGNGVVAKPAAKAGEGRYTLTEWGRYLAEPVCALGRWGAPLMDVQEEGDAFQGQWLALPIDIIFGGVDPSRPPFAAEIRAAGQAVTLRSADGEVHFAPGPADAPDLVLTGPPDGVLGLLSGRLDRRGAEAGGVSILGDLDTLVALRRADWLTGPEALPRAG
ncbi:MAG: winged helix-turn-helix transcriptional regulator [Actinocrinis sp.]